MTRKLAHTVLRSELRQRRPTVEAATPDPIETSVVVPVPMGLTAEDLSEENKITSLEGVQDLLECIRWSSGCPFPCLLGAATQHQGTGWTRDVIIKATAVVKDIHGTGTITVAAGETITLPASAALVFNRTVKMIQRLWLHEMHESLLFAGVRVLDPHKERP